MSITLDTLYNLQFFHAIYKPSYLFVIFMNLNPPQIFTCRICRNISDFSIIWFIKKTPDVYYVLWYVLWYLKLNQVQHLCQNSESNSYLSTSVGNTKHTFNNYHKNVRFD